MRLKQLKEQYGDGSHDSKYQKIERKVKGRQEKAVKALAEYMSELFLLRGAEYWFDPESWAEHKEIPTATQLRDSVTTFGLINSYSVPQELEDLHELLTPVLEKLMKEKGKARFDFSAKHKEMRRMKIAMKRRDEKVKEEEEERSRLQDQAIQLRRRWF